MDHSLRNKKILITCGPTWVPIDEMRVISNRSSGELGQQLALKCAAAGAKVTLLEGPVRLPLQSSRNVRIIKFELFDELNRLVREELRSAYDIVVHAAAVSDYKLKKPLSGKMDSKNVGLHLELVPTPKIIQTIKRYNRKVFLVGFKLETTFNSKTLQSKTASLFDQAGCDAVVANSLSRNTYKAYLLNRDRTVLSRVNSKFELIDQLVKLFIEL